MSRSLFTLSPWKGFWIAAGSGCYRECYHGCGRVPSEQICTFLLGACLGEGLPDWTTGLQEVCAGVSADLQDTME